jgi:hypothetical protein
MIRIIGVLLDTVSIPSVSTNTGFKCRFPQTVLTVRNRLEACLLTRQIGNFPISSISYRRKIAAGIHKFKKKTHGSLPNFSCQKGDKKQVPQVDSCWSEM